jgi:hypothetical protein
MLYETVFDMITITNFVAVPTILGISSAHDVAKIFISRKFVQKCKNCIPSSLTILNEAFEGQQV